MSVIIVSFWPWICVIDVVVRTDVVSSLDCLLSHQSKYGLQNENTKTLLQSFISMNIPSRGSIDL